MPLNLDEFTGHTPGPWHQGDGHGTGKGYAICSGPQILAKVNGNGYPAGIGNAPESDANAALIAAAPDILEECKRYRAALEAVRNLSGEIGKHVEIYDVCNNALNV